MGQTREHWGRLGNKELTLGRTGEGRETKCRLRSDWGRLCRLGNTEISLVSSEKTWEDWARKGRLRVRLGQTG